MPSICFYFQVHQPYRMRHYHIFDIGQKDKSYFDDAKNKEVCLKVAKKCYLPTNALMLELIKRHQGNFRISYSISGVALEQFAEYAPEVLESFKKLVDTGCVEILAETYYHSLSSLFDGAEFRAQVKKHRDLVKYHFGVEPKIFRNTELIYSNGIAEMVEDMGYKAMLAEGFETVLDWRSPNFVYEPQTTKNMRLLMKNYKLSDDIAFRFSQQSWGEWPLTTEKFTHWVKQIEGNGDILNLFMDYETFGEHQWEETGIFNFLSYLPAAVFDNTSFDFATPSEVIERYPSRGRIDVPGAMSWADSERDLSAWLGNAMQDGMVVWLYSFDKQVKELGDEHLLHTWRKLQTSDHFYYMCTKYWSDGDVHKYFSVYDYPHQSYTIMNNVLSDFDLRIRDLEADRKPVHVKVTEIKPDTLNVNKSMNSNIAVTTSENILSKPVKVKVSLIAKIKKVAKKASL